MHLILDGKNECPDWLKAQFGIRVGKWFWTQYLIRKERERREGLRRQKLVAAENFRMQHRGVDGLGQVVFRIDPMLRKSIAEEYGWDAAVNDEFCSELLRDNPDLRFRPTYKRKAEIVVPATRWSKVG